MSDKKEEKYWFEDKEIRTDLPTEVKTPMGESIHLITFTDNSTMEIPSMRLHAMRSTEKCDATSARAALTKEIAQKIYAMMLEYGVKVTEVDPVVNDLIKLVNDTQSLANCILWKVDHDYDRDLLQVNKILIEKYGPSGKKDDNSEPASK